MSDNLTALPDQARFQIDDRVRSAAEARLARSTDRGGRRRHRFAEQLRSVADRLDV